MAHKIIFEYHVFDNLHGLESSEAKLVAEALRACDSAYAPYSRFRVGAAVLLEDGSVVIGSNQENMAYPSGLCAERVALFAAHSQFPTAKIAALAIAARGFKGQISHPVTPCGACRQVMAEYEMLQEDPFKVLLAHEDGEVWRIGNATSLLPIAFFAPNLGMSGKP